MEVDDLGELFRFGEFWQFRYRACGHITNWPRDPIIGYGFDPEPLAREIREHQRTCAECTAAARPLIAGPADPPSRDDIIQLRLWLRTAKLPDPMLTMPGVEAHNPELTRRLLLAETNSESGPRTAVLELRYLAARYGPPEISALAKPHQLPGDPRGPQF